MKKIILSRKGFDSVYGGMASPIFPEGDLLSLPIPTEDKDSYGDLKFNGKPYSDIINEIKNLSQNNS